MIGVGNVRYNSGDPFSQLRFEIREDNGSDEPDFASSLVTQSFIPFSDFSGSDIGPSDQGGTIRKITWDIPAGDIFSLDTNKQYWIRFGTDQATSTDWMGSMQSVIGDGATYRQNGGYSPPGNIVFELSSVPIPTAIWLMGTGLLVLSRVARKRHL